MTAETKEKLKRESKRLVSSTGPGVILFIKSMLLVHPELAPQ